MWPFANTRRSFVFVRFCDSDAHLCSRTGLFANSSFVFVRDPHFREHRPLEKMVSTGTPNRHGSGTLAHKASNRSPKGSLVDLPRELLKVAAR